MKRALSAFALFGLLSFVASETVDAGLFCRAKTICCEPVAVPCTPAPAPVCCEPAPVVAPCYSAAPVHSAPIHSVPVYSPPVYSVPVHHAQPVCNGSAPYGYGVAAYGPHWF